jgi:hypothetical protein
MSRHTPRLLALATLTACLLAPGAFAAPAAGEKWRITTSMSAQGMTLPGQSSEVCQPVNSNETVVMDREQSNCTITDRRRSGNTESFAMRCTGEEPMEGRMEITHLGPDHYRGRMRATSNDGTFEMTYEGRKLGGSCDPGALERQAQAAVAQSQAQLAATCRQMAAEGQASMFLGPDATCSSASDKAALCKVVKDYAGMDRLLATRRAAAQAPRGYPDDSAQVAALCGFQVDAHATQLCGRAQSAGKMAFLARNCPTLAEPIARRECVGRGYTTPVASGYGDFCAAWAQANGDTASAEADSGDARAPEERGTGDALREGAREALKGILGF